MVPNLILVATTTYLIQRHALPSHDFSLLALSATLIQLCTLYLYQVARRPSVQAAKEPPIPEATTPKEVILPRQDVAQGDVSTLIKNAMRISFPNNALHVTETEERIKRALSKLSPEILEKMVEIGGNLKPDSRPAPFSLALHLQRVRSIRVLLGSLNGELCLIKTLVDVESLEEEDLDVLTRTVAVATSLPRIPTLRATLGCCWSPTVMIAEEACFFISLREVAVELRAHGIKLDWQLFKPLAVSLAQCLATLHHAGLVHRELSLGTVNLTSATTCSLAPLGFLHAIPEGRRKVRACVGGSF